jgi:hypothetical protein
MGGGFLGQAVVYLLAAVIAVPIARRIGLGSVLGYLAAHRSAQTFRRHDELAVRELTAARHDAPTYISHARQRIHDLEQILLDEQAPRGDDHDAGWDTTSLRDDIKARLRDRP